MTPSSHFFFVFYVVPWLFSTAIPVPPKMEVLPPKTMVEPAIVLDSEPLLSFWVNLCKSIEPGHIIIISAIFIIGQGPFSFWGFYSHYSQLIWTYVKKAIQYIFGCLPELIISISDIIMRFKWIRESWTLSWWLEVWRPYWVQFNFVPQTRLEFVTVIALMYPIWAHRPITIGIVVA